MKDKNIVRKNVIQMIRAAILQKEKDGGVELKDEEIMQIIAKEAKTRRILYQITRKVVEKT